MSKTPLIAALRNAGVPEPNVPEPEPKKTKQQKSDFHVYDCVHCLIERAQGKRKTVNKCTDNSYVCSLKKHALQLPEHTQPAWNTLPEIHRARLFQILVPWLIAMNQIFEVDMDAIDPMQKKVDMANGMTEEEWQEKESAAHTYTCRKMVYGHLKEGFLGNAPGWVKLREGNSFHSMDVYNSTLNAVAEVKNKHNTTNSGSHKSVRENFASENALGRKVYYVIMTSSGTQKEMPDYVNRLTGDEAYDVFFGRENIASVITDLLCTILKQKLTVQQLAHALLGL